MHSTGRDCDASTIEAPLRQDSGASDPRTLAIFLATRRESSETGRRLAKGEFGSRSDVFTHDTLAWSLAAAGKFGEARKEMENALAEGTQDGRLFFHAAMIASETGDDIETRLWLDKANSLSHLLLPSERNELQNLAARRANKNVSFAPKPQKTFPFSKTS